MNLGEMVDEISSLTGYDSHADIIKRLNRCHEREARDLMFPQYYLKVTGVDDAFSLPSGARADGLLEVRRESDGTPLPIRNTQEADRKYPNWKDWDAGNTVFIVYDPKTVGGDGLVRPVPLPGDDDQDYVITYVAKPDPMTSLTDEPWNGMHDSYHQVLVHYVTYEIMSRLGNPAAQEQYAFYDRLRRNAFTASQPRTIMPRNAIYNSVFRSVD